MKVSSLIHISLVPCEGRRELLEISLDGDLWRRVHTSIFGRRCKLPTTATSLSDWEQLFMTLEHQAAKRYALHQLARKAQTSMELSQTLEEKCVSEVTINRVIEELSTSGYFDDTDWVRRYVGQQMQQGRGTAVIKQKLKLKGIPESLINEQLAASREEVSVDDQIQRLLETRFRNRNLADHKERQKVIGALARRGFALDDIFRVLS